MNNLELANLALIIENPGKILIKKALNFSYAAKVCDSGCEGVFITLYGKNKGSVRLNFVMATGDFVRNLSPKSIVRALELANNYEVMQKTGIKYTCIENLPSNKLWSIDKSLIDFIGKSK